MDKISMLNIINQFKGSRGWICDTLKVHKSTLSRFLRDERNSEQLSRRLPDLLLKLVDTNGACMFNVDGKSVRSEVKKYRRRAKKGGRK